MVCSGHSQAGCTQLIGLARRVYSRRNVPTSGTPPRIPAEVPNARARTHTALAAAPKNRPSTSSKTVDIKRFFRNGDLYTEGEPSATWAIESHGTDLSAL